MVVGWPPRPHHVPHGMRAASSKQQASGSQRPRRAPPAGLRRPPSAAFGITRGGMDNNNNHDQGASLPFWSLEPVATNGLSSTSRRLGLVRGLSNYWTCYLCAVRHQQSASSLVIPPVSPWGPRSRAFVGPSSFSSIFANSTQIAALARKFL